MLTRRWHNGTCQGECGPSLDQKCGPSLDQNSEWLLACCIVFAGIGMEGGLTSQVATANTIPMKHAAMQDSSKTSCTRARTDAGLADHGAPLPPRRRPWKRAVLAPTAAAPLSSARTLCAHEETFGLPATRRLALCDVPHIASPRRCPKMAGEEASIDDRGSDCLATGKLAPGNLGLFNSIDPTRKPRVHRSN
jgi:hypothetical protein